VLKFYVDPIFGESQTGYFNKTAKGGLPEDVVVVENIKRPWNKCNNGDNEIT
jgi:hypothetical protein